MGYKLAYNLQRSQKYVAAVSVCHKVLAAYPTYPKIRQDVLDKARIHMKP